MAVVKISSSKSLVNRYLILKQGHSQLNLDWTSNAKDVLNLDHALKSAPHSETYDLGEGGTTLRFFAIYLSTFKGSWILNCKESLLKRPQSELVDALSCLGVSLKQLSATSLHLESKGWTSGNIAIDVKDTTQVLTGLVLAAVSRGFPLKIKIRSRGLNSDYFKMTSQFLEQLGFAVEISNDVVRVAGGQKALKLCDETIESDWSSAAFLLVLASLKGELQLETYADKSLQPDAVVTSLLQRLGASLKNVAHIENGELPYKAFELNIQKCPDLFPVLSVLACFCEGESSLYGAPQLKNKETNRIEKVYELLTDCGYEVEKRTDGLVVQGKGLVLQNLKTISFDASKDHRLYMACELLSAMGYKMNVTGEESIYKSFAEYEELKRGALACFF